MKTHLKKKNRKKIMNKITFRHLHVNLPGLTEKLNQKPYTVETRGKISFSFSLQFA